MHKDTQSIAPSLSRRQRLVLTLAACWTLVVLGSTWLVDRQRIDQYLAQVVSDAEQRAGMAHDGVENSFQQTAALGQVLADQSAFRDFLRANALPAPTPAQPAEQPASQTSQAPQDGLRERLLSRPDVQRMSELRLPLNFGALSPGFMRRSCAEPPASVAHTAWG